MRVERLSKPEDFPPSIKLTYLDTASISLMYRPASDAIVRWYEDLAQSGTLNFDEEAEEHVFDGLRDVTAELLGASASDIAIGSSATELISSLAWSMVPDKHSNIVSTMASHPSTNYPWQRVARHAGCEFRFAKPDKDGIINMKELLSLIDSQTHIVAISHVEYRTGQKYDLRILAEKSHHHGATLIVDATQSAGQAPIDVRKENVDALISSAYKWLCGPFGVAIMYLGPHLQSTLDPGLVGWRSHKDMWKFQSERLEYPSTAKRFEASTIAYGCALGLERSIQYLVDIGIEKINQHNMALTKIFENEVVGIGGKVLIPQRDTERSSIISFMFPGLNSENITRHLGVHNVAVSERSGAIRVAPHLYNDQDDVEYFIQVIREIVK